MNTLDIWWTIRNKHGWLADCKEVGYSQDQLDQMEEMENYYSDVESDVRKFTRPIDEDISKTTLTRPTSNLTYKVRAAREYPLYKYLNLSEGDRIPCPFHQGEEENFMVKNVGYCFVCAKKVNSIDWLMEIENYSFVDAVQKLNP